jgi:hypothetical protein
MAVGSRLNELADVIFNNLKRVLLGRLNGNTIFITESIQS